MTTPGLRERKKARTRWAIQEHALRLFAEQGYDATTVDQIAAAAEISPSTFFRYFPTKEDVVVQDEFDEVFVEAFRAAGAAPDPLEALRRTALLAITGADGEERAKSTQRTRLKLCFAYTRSAIGVSMPVVPSPSSCSAIQSWPVRPASSTPSET